MILTQRHRQRQRREWTTSLGWIVIAINFASLVRGQNSALVAEQVVAPATVTGTNDTAETTIVGVTGTASFSSSTSQGIQQKQQQQQQEPRMDRNAPSIDISASSPIDIKITVPPASTSPPTFPIYNELFPGVVILADCDTLEGVSIINFEDVTATHLRRMIITQHNDRYPFAPMMDLRVAVNLYVQHLYAVKRHIETTTTNQISNVEEVHLLQISFDTFVSFRSGLAFEDVTLYITDLITKAFEANERREEYIYALIQTGDPAYHRVVQMQLTDIGGQSLQEKAQEQEQLKAEISQLQANTNSNSEHLNMRMWIIIGSAAGGGALLSLTLILLLKKKPSRVVKVTKQVVKDADGKTLMLTNSNGSSPMHMHNHNNKHPPIAVGHQIGVLEATPEIHLNTGTSEEISTLGDPIYNQHGGMVVGQGGFGGSNLERDERTASVGNDYDYLNYVKQQYRLGLAVPGAGGATGAASSTLADTSTVNTTHTRQQRSQFTSEEQTRAAESSIGTQTKMQMAEMQNNSNSFFSEDDMSFEKQYAY